MNRLAPLLAVTTLTLAASTFYCAHLLQLKREQNARMATRPTLPSPVAPATPLPKPNVIAAAPAVEPTRDDANDAKAKSRSDPGLIAQAQHRLDDLRDPAKRAERARQIASLLRGDWRSVAPQIGMSQAELERFLAAKAEDALQFQQRRAECQIDPACDMRAFSGAYQKASNDRTAALLGPETYARLLAFQDSSGERNIVYFLNAHLPNALSDATADRLVHVLSEQRRQFVQDAAARGEKFENYDGWIGSAAMAGAADEHARRMESATEDSRRQVELVSGILTPEQLAGFKELTEKSLHSFDEDMQEAEIAKSARAAAGTQP